MAKNNGTVVAPCTCEDEQQDKLYGNKMRLHNMGGTRERPLGFCTVCSPSTSRTLRHLQGKPLSDKFTRGKPM